MKLLLDHVVERMHDVGIREGRVLMARDALQMASYLRRGRVDWVSETGAGAVLLQERAKAETLVLSERNGIRRYRTIYLARRDSEVKSLDDLRGRRIAFQNRTSTSAYYIPAMELLAHHIPLEVLGSLGDQPGPDTAGFLFARTERNIATWVHKGLVDVGAVSNLDWANPQHIPEFFRRDLVILRESQDVPRGIEVVRRDLDPVVRQRLLVAIGKDPAGDSPPELVKQNQRFFDLEERDRRDLQWLRSGVARVSAEIE
ncbi:MAG: ABC transporter, phosphonate, periplasmic substrate-binding protein [Alphaproteobacteria bacterium ADurb.BinA280]|nr:MAG: ABC transporter, phosphonate, periplasmic substrate-binding protein [Alphaproteobacteria bacterium ADurb.BinA280]